MANSDHFTDIRGHHINLGVTQDALGPNCEHCGRTVIPRASGGTAPEAWQHAIDCPEYLPHPDSIAGQPNYTPSA